MNDAPIAYFITWTVYGTFLQGDSRGWRKRRKGEQPAQPRLDHWRLERLKYPIQLLSHHQRLAVDTEIDRLAEFRGWQLWARSARSNHVHVLLSAAGFSGKKVRDQLKANCTRVLREQWQQFVDRPVWSTGGDFQCINGEDDLHVVRDYIAESQDRKHRAPLK